MTPKLVGSLATGALTLLAAVPARACPLCVSETGRRVRAGLFGAHFGRDLLVTLLPFPVLLGVIALIHFGPPWPRGRGGTPAPPGAGDPTPEDRP